MSSFFLASMCSGTFIAFASANALSYSGTYLEYTVSKTISRAYFLASRAYFFSSSFGRFLSGRGNFSSTLSIAVRVSSAISLS